jgi:hypothetical protein
MGTPIPTSPHSTRAHSPNLSHSPQASESSLYSHQGLRDVSCETNPKKHLWNAEREVADIVR